MLKFILPLVMILCSCGEVEAQSLNDGAGGVHMFGDSIFATINHRTRDVLQNSIHKYIEDHSYTGAWSWQIVNQYKAVRYKRVKVAVLDGGGNDVMGNGGECRGQPTDKCKTVMETAARNLKEVFNLMYQDGVHHIVFVGCHYDKNGNYNQAVDYSYTLVEDACAHSGTLCTLIDPREVFRDPNLLEWDGIHPNYNGTKAMADLIYEIAGAAGVDW